ncbi:hypothetical protein WJX72_006737 [[Myrmecia] bisecta]|uniref:Uncharacterized protein n=1 Tax=[Myrmecia] bisecta TaxID=41462 RepID=A0AAW1Q3J8_9CHLO
MGGLTTDVRPGGYAIVTMCSEPVNLMTMDLWQQLRDTLERLENDPAVRGVIFASGLQRDVFTAGNDFKELYAPSTSADRYRDFWVLQNQFLARLYRSPLVTIAAIRGACPAGGCGMAMACDLRIMTEAGHIGLNEVAVGISVPLFWSRLMARVIGDGPAERLCQFAVFLSPQQAKQVGLVNEVTSKENLLPAAEAAMQQMLRSPDGGRQITKENMRGAFAREWEAYCGGEAAGAWKQLCNPATVKALAATMQRLSKKGAKPKL